ncbi:MAG: hypothetical protein AAB941_00280 [Patescibacteria group bacterium]
MKVFLKLLPIYATLIGAQLIFSYFNYTFLFSRIKSGIYHVPLFGDLTSWWKFVVAVWVFNAPSYILGTILVAWSVKLSLTNFGVMYTSIIVGQVITIIMTLFFMWYKMGELPSRNGWIALGLVFLASLFAANSGRNV